MIQTMDGSVTFLNLRGSLWSLRMNILKLPVALICLHVLVTMTYFMLKVQINLRKAKRFWC